VCRGEALTLRRVSLPLLRPYVLSYRTFREFEPNMIEARNGAIRSVGAKEQRTRLQQ
jgi:hypothetical protein